MELLTSLASGLVAALVTLHFGLRNHRSIHAWNEKYRLYSEVIECFTTIITFCEAKASLSMGPAYLPPQHDGEKFAAAKMKLAEVSETAGWILPPEVCDILQESLPDINQELTGGFDSLEEWTGVIYTAIAAARRPQLAKIVRIARHDLGFGESRWRRVWRWMQVNLSLDWT